MADVISFEGISASGDENRLLLTPAGVSSRNGVGRLLDAMPWWVLVVFAVLTFLFLHQLADADVGQAYHPTAVGPTAPQAILIILAGAGQYLFPALLLGEAAGVAVARRVRARKAPAVDQGDADGVAGQIAGGAENGPLLGDRGAQPPAQRVWSVALLNRMGARRFAALAMAYYREKGIRCDLLPSGTDGAVVLKLFQEGAGKAPVVLQFRARSAAWVGEKQIWALRGVMDREGVEKGLFMTPGVFSKDAKACALANGVTLIDGNLFLMMVRWLAPAARERLLELAMGDEVVVRSVCMCRV